MSDMAVSDPGSPSADAVNDLFDYDVGLDDIVFPDNATSNAPVSKPPTQDPSGLGLGLDEEVTVTKKRQPVAKLDEGRLLSQRGIPKLRHTAKHKLKFKGKGHEFSDAARLLNFYQLWLDDLFPRAKFADGLAMIEKLGHSKRIQTMRREWIDEEKPRLFDEDPVPEAPKSGELPSDNVDATGPSVAATGQPHQNRPFQQTHSEEGTAHRELFIPDPTKDTRPTTSHPEPEDDDLDDLLREKDEAMDDVAPTNPSESMSQAPDRGHDNYDAEYEVMQELGI